MNDFSLEKSSRELQKADLGYRPPKEQKEPLNEKLKTALKAIDSPKESKEGFAPFFSKEKKKAQHAGAAGQSSPKEFAKLEAERIFKQQAKGPDPFPYEKIQELAKQENILVELIKLLVLKHEWDVSQHIQDYTIQNEQARLEIAKLAIERDALGLAENLQNYGIQNQEAKHEILVLAFLKNKNVLLKTDSFGLEKTCYSFTRKIAERFRFHANSKAPFLEFLSEIESLSKSQHLDLKPLISLIKKEGQREVTEACLSLLMLALLKSGGPGGEHLVSWLNSNPRELEALFSYRNPRRRLEMTKLLFDQVLAHPKEMQTAPRKNRWSCIPHLLLQALYAQGKILQERCKEVNPSSPLL